jgi:acetolactate synthase-1/2/3 large subunit
MCYEAGLQEAALDHEVPLPPPGAVRVPAGQAPDPAALANAADALADAERPIVIADFAARPPDGWDHVIGIAETLGAPVWDCNSRLNFPSNHPLNLSMAPKECYDGADVVLALDFERPTHVRDIATRTVVNMVPQTATWIDIGLN